jgi:hypothetical protein
MEDMTLEMNELEVYYNEGGLNQKLEKALRECLKEFDYEEIGSGMDMTSHTRDLVFRKVG